MNFKNASNFFESLGEEPWNMLFFVTFFWFLTSRAGAVLKNENEEQRNVVKNLKIKRTQQPVPRSTPPPPSSSPPAPFFPKAQSQSPTLMTFLSMTVLWYDDCKSELALNRGSGDSKVDQ